MKLRFFPITEEVKNNIETYRPVRAHANDVGADVKVPYTVTLEPHKVTRIPLGFGIDVPYGYGAFVFPRSGKSSEGVITLLPPIDPEYTAEITAITLNPTDEPITLEKGTKVGQLVILPVAIAEYVLPEEFGEKRGENGFGSSDLKK